MRRVVERIEEETGSVLVEAMVAAIMITITAVGVFSAFDTATRTTANERHRARAEAKAAREAFITSATNTVMPVVRIDGAPIGNGAPGLLTQRLRSEFHGSAEKSDP